ncbi:MAG: hypothetical protein KDE09_07565 [Anaerolineales bacterium]|nr:hypothetical protein [Anaerolineales bacterium]MCB0013703.1 hypothetical protein [Anaerolineales bacterium]MCB0017632.1 hypothetical protein [Anaerolineales bacterium]MCB0028510.1 hypothetical protein [Anaerolineales bacterium]MCB8962251.1 hypothetical protein [Ardenticatenales bacterium]
MQTLMLNSKPRKGSTGNTFTIEVIGDSPVKDKVREAIQALEHHPAKASRRSIIDLLGIIEQFNFQIRFTEHYLEDELEGWTFIVQG